MSLSSTCVDLKVTCPAAAACLRIAKRLGLPALGDHRFHRPLFVRPNRVNAEKLYDLIESFGAEEGAQTRRRSMKMAALSDLRMKIRARRADQ